MSVDFGTFAGYGFVISAEQVKEFKEKDRDCYDALCDDGYLFRLNSYSENSDYFYGERFCGCDPGEHLKLSEIIPRKYSAEQFYIDFVEPLLERKIIEEDGLSLTWGEPQLVICSVVS